MATDAALPGLAGTIPLHEVTEVPSPRTPVDIGELLAELGVPPAAGDEAQCAAAAPGNGTMRESTSTTAALRDAVRGFLRFRPLPIAVPVPVVHADTPADCAVEAVTEPVAVPPRMPDSVRANDAPATPDTSDAPEDGIGEVPVEPMPRSVTEPPPADRADPVPPSWPGVYTGAVPPPSWAQERESEDRPADDRFHTNRDQLFHPPEPRTHRGLIIAAALATLGLAAVAAAVLLGF